MIYPVKTGNFKEFAKFKENVLTPRSYFIPFADREEMDKTDIRTERYESSRVAVLSGAWNFKYYEKCTEMPEKFNTDEEKMDKIVIPSTWQHTGYERPYYVNIRYQFPVNPPQIPEDCPAAIYSKKFVLNEIEGNYTITFLGVVSSLDLFVNGKYVGYSEGSHNSAEFEIKPFLISGVNEVLAVVHKWCNGSYLEAQDMFRDNGIFRDVYVTKTENNSIYDFAAETEYNTSGTYNLKVTPVFKLTDECTFTVELFDGTQEMNRVDNTVAPDKVCSITMPSLKVQQWSAELPKLYTLYLTLSKNGAVIETIRKKIGFRNIKIKENIYFFNNEKIKIKGVNHHDTNPKNGYVMSIEDMEKDIKLFKEYNCNAVRTSHYPPDPAFLDLCDEYGVYVVDEADIETHGCCAVHKPNLVSNNIKWAEHYWDRVLRMYQRDKNHPSIILWSLGNESGGWKCQDYCYENLRKLTPIPIHYEGACRTPRRFYDVYSEMYPHSDKVMKIAKGKGPGRYQKVPYFMCEYAHAMGVGAGSLEDYMQAIYAGDNVMGGCIWEFADHAVYHEDGDYKYTYGGDHGERIHDANFCVDGLFMPDRTPNPGALNMKCAYRPVRAERIDDNTYAFRNLNFFKKIEHINVVWTLLENGEGVARGCEKLDIAPQQTQKVRIEFKSINRKKDNVIIFRYEEEDGFEIAKEQFELSKATPMAVVASEQKLTVNPVENKLEIIFENGSAIFNKATGAIESYIYDGVQMFNQSPVNAYKGPGIELYRAPFDNDMNMRRNWDKMRLGSLLCSCKKCTVKENSNKIDISVVLEGNTPIRYFWDDFVSKFVIDYTIYSDGRIRVKAVMNKLSGIRNLPRFGISLEMPKAFHNVSYYGLGDETNLSDFKEHVVLGVYNTKVSEMHHPYVKPQESGMRSETRWATVTNLKGQGLRFDYLDKYFTFNANHYTVSQLAKYAHAEDVHEMNTTNVHIDGYMMGTGSNSCGPRPLGQYLIPKSMPLTFSFLITPLPNCEEVNDAEFEPVEVVEELISDSVESYYTDAAEELIEELAENALDLEAE